MRPGDLRPARLEDADGRSESWLNEIQTGSGGVLAQSFSGHIYEQDEWPGSALSLLD